jgi:hypothetical protein
MGTDFIGNIFGPVMLGWFVAIGLLGLLGIMRFPGILVAISPHYAVSCLLHAGPGIAFAVLGAAFLALTGAEALYGDMGHFGRWPIHLGRFAGVVPAREVCCSRIRTPPRTRFTFSPPGGRIIPWSRSPLWLPSSPRNRSFLARIR